MKKHGSVLSAAILLAGGCIGTGFYAVPINAGPAGFYPAAITTILVWFYMLATGFLYLESTLACPDGSNVISISRRLIGKAGMVIAGISFFMTNFFYLTSLLLLSGDLLSLASEHWLHLKIHKIWFFIGTTLLFGGVVFWGTYASDRLNFILFIGLLAAFFGTVFLGMNQVRLENLMPRSWYLVVFSVPIIVTAIDYQSLIPTLSTYLKRDSKKLVKTILIALLFPLVLYLIWIWLIIGSTPFDVLWKAYEQNSPIFEGFLLLNGHQAFQTFFHFTSLFAITTSIIGTGLAGTDFLSDAFNIPVEKRIGIRRLWACSGFFLTGLFLSILIPAAIHNKTGYIVGLAEVVFNGAIPIWLAVRARYILNLEMKQILPGGKWLIFALGLATFLLIYLEGVHVVGPL